MRIGTVCYATTQGLGYLAKSFYDAGVITDVMVFRHPHGNRPSHMEWYPKGTIELTHRPFVGEKIERWMDDLQAVIFFETPFDWAFPKRCRERGLKTIIIPMYEWFLERPPHQFDLFLNPSLLDQEYFPYGQFLPIPVDPSRWKLRTTAKHFIHNAGHIGSRNHKGTVELLQAMQYVTSDVQLTVRSQESTLLDRIRKETKADLDSRIKFQFGEIPYESLFNEGDVYIAPEKYNGLSLPLQEAYAAGMPVMTTDRFPINTWLPKELLIPSCRYQRARTMNGHLEFTESVVDPRDIAAKIDLFYGQDLSPYSLQGKTWAEQNSWEVLKPRYLQALEVLCQSA